MFPQHSDRSKLGLRVRLWAVQTSRRKREGEGYVLPPPGCCYFGYAFADSPCEKGSATGKNSRKDFPGFPPVRPWGQQAISDLSKVYFGLERDGDPQGAKLSITGTE